MLKRLAIVLLAALALAAPAFADEDYTDPTGDNAAGIDISSIHVANDPTAGTVTFTVTLANYPTQTSDGSVAIFLNTDRSESTGDPQLDGSDYQFELDQGGWSFEEWNSGSGAWMDVGDQVVDFDVTFANGVLTWQFGANDLGGVPSFGFYVATAKGDPSAPAIDFAPDKEPDYVYTLVVAKPTVKSTIAKVGGSAKAGKSVSVTSLSVDLSNGTVVPATKLSCTATLGGKALAGSGAGHCTFKLPATAKRKTLVVRVNGLYGATKVFATKTFKVQ